MSQHILYSFRRCPYAMRARFALIANKVNYEHREILLRNKPQSMLNYSPKGTVPVLVLNDGTVVDESLDVMKFAYNIEGEVDALIHENDTFFKRNLDRYKYGNRFPEEGALNLFPIKHIQNARFFYKN